FARPQLEGLEGRVALSSTPIYAASLDSNGNLAINQEVNAATANLSVSLAGGYYTFTDIGSLTFDLPTGAGAASISGGGTPSITVCTSAGHPIHGILGNRHNQFPLTGTGGAAAAPLSVNAGMIPGDQITITGAWTDSGDVTLTSTTIVELGNGAIS